MQLLSVPLSLLIQLTGVLDDCFCDVESIDVFNNFKVYPLIRKLTERDFFKYYKVSLLHLPNMENGSLNVNPDSQEITC